MFIPTHYKDRTRYSEFHNDHDHDTNDYVDLQKEIEMCVRNGRLSHLARGAKAQDNSQNATPSSIAKKAKDQVDWKQKISETKAVNEVLMTNEKWSPPCHESRTSQPSTNITFSSDDLIPKHCNGDNPLIIKANIGGWMIHCIHIGSKTIMMDRMIVRVPAPYNVILGLPRMRQLGGIASTIHSEEVSPKSKNDIPPQNNKAFLEELQKNAYHGWIDKDAMDQMAKVLEMIDLIYIPGVDSH
nr:reverse transcriptase domain-containing protein [Tanacetum cinerariifolium]